MDFARAGKASEKATATPQCVRRFWGSRPFLRACLEVAPTPDASVSSPHHLIFRHSVSVVLIGIDVYFEMGELDSFNVMLELLPYVW